MKNKLKRPLTPALSPEGARGKAAAIDALLKYEHIKVPYASVWPDPNQPRKTFSEASLKELADSIREQGILQDLILEFVPALYRIIEPELHHADFKVEELKDGHWYRAFGHAEKDTCVSWAGTLNLEDHYRIVCGERRWRAAGLLELKELPAKVYRNLTAQQRFAFQFIENNQREAVTAIEEAEAMATQLASRRADKPDFSPEDLAAELGISRAGCYERLKLTRLHPPVRAALLAGKISTSVAGEVAKLPTPQSQEKLLKTITDEKSYSFPYSVRDVQELIDDEYCKQLSEAPFKTDKVYRDNYDIAIGGDTCTVCPLRTGNMVADFPDLKSKPNVCTNPVCFGEKCKAHWLEKATDLKEKGKTVLTSTEFKKVYAEYVSADLDSRYNLFHNEWDSPAKILGKHAPEPVIVSTAEGLKKYFKRTDIPDAAKKAKVKLCGDKSATATPEEKAKLEAKEKEHEAMLERRQVFAQSLLPKLAAAISKIKDADAWKLLGKTVKAPPWEKSKSALLKQVATDRAKVLVDGLWSRLGNLVENDDGDAASDSIALWKSLGIDFAAEFAAEEKAAQKALPLAKAEPKYGKLLDVKPAKKKKGKKS